MMCMDSLSSFISYSHYHESDDSIIYLDTFFFAALADLYADGDSKVNIICFDLILKYASFPDSKDSQGIH